MPIFRPGTARDTIIWSRVHLQPEIFIRVIYGWRVEMSGRDCRGVTLRHRSPSPDRDNPTLHVGPLVPTGSLSL